MKKILSICLCLCALSVGAAFAAISHDDFLELCSSGSVRQVEAAIRAGANVNAEGPFGMRPLFEAIEGNNSLEVIIALIKAGADVNVKGSLFGGTALTKAIESNSLEVIIALIRAGANVHAKCDGMTILEYADEKNSNSEIINELIKAGAK